MNATLLLYLGVTKPETRILEKLFTEHLAEERLIIIYTKATLYLMLGIALTAECKVISFTDEREFIPQELRRRFNAIPDYKNNPCVKTYKTKKFQRLDFAKQLKSCQTYLKNKVMGAVYGVNLTWKHKNEETKRKAEIAPQAEWRRIFNYTSSNFASRGSVDFSLKSTVPSVSSVPTPEFYQKTVESVISKIK